jgi:DNA-binding CsgD family transcriptional regulator
VDIREVLRQLQMNQTERAIARAMGIDRKTVGG